ncbi:MAG: ABC transporter ATP-binding protein/permease [Xanthomonadales bacterium]|jgi:ABC-type bacteriocin/lantibiotic exporter with double-glycine peptidase domain|nr:ABC transporter ATP-binding protein/permease [Xanthomonadales bacterium]
MSGARTMAGQGLLGRLKVLAAQVQVVGGPELRRVPLLLALMLLSSVFDLLGVALIIPFLALVIGGPGADVWLPEVVRGVAGPHLIEFVGLGLVAMFTLKALGIFVVQGLIVRFSERIRASVMVRLLSAYQRKTYRWHLSMNSGELVNRVMYVSNSFSTGFIGAGLRLTADLLVFMLIGLLIFTVNPQAFLLLVLLLGSVAVLVHQIVRRRSAQLTRESMSLYGSAIQSVNQAVGGLREIRLIGCEPYFLDRLQRVASQIVNNSTRLTILQLMPRNSIELAIILFIVAIVLLGVREGATGTLVPVLGMIGASAVRLAPAATSLLTNFNAMRANRVLVDRLYVDLTTEEDLLPEAALGSHTGIPMQSVELDAVWFRYGAQLPWVLRGHSMRIVAGESVGLMGPSGAGKSTIADLLLGFLEPERGVVRVNGDSDFDRRRWQASVAYIPQVPYLLDDTLRRNIALGVADADIDEARVMAAVEGASLRGLLERLPEGLDTQLGERGVRISGGQRQRVSIARALYHDRTLIVMDEATSALDEQTELEIIETIRTLSGRKTLVIIAHRESTLACCHRIERLYPADDAQTA